jgi:hypothetical protein
MGHWSLVIGEESSFIHVQSPQNIPTYRPQREDEEDAVADGRLSMDASEEAKEATDGDLLMGGFELVLDDDRCRWLLADSDCKSLHLALDDKLFIIIPGRVGEGVGLEVLEKKLARCRC